MIKPRLSFTYNGLDLHSLKPEIRESAASFRYRLPDGLEMETSIESFDAYGVIRWINYWRNPTAHTSGLISELWDCDVTVPLGTDEEKSPGVPVTVFASKGSNCAFDDFMIEPHTLDENGHYEARSKGGRSADGVLPFFDVNDGESGVMIAVGWTGQWEAQLDRTENRVRIRTGLPEASFRMLPGEEFCTGSVTLLPYSGGIDRAHNTWRRYLKNEVSPIGRYHGERGSQVPFSAIFWGGVSSEALLRRWKGILENGLPFECCWIDAGWYEPLRGITTKEQLSEWSNIGTWETNRFFHPDGYRDAVDTLHAQNIKMMVWMEPERVRKSVKAWTESTELPGRYDSLAALNQETVREDMTAMVSRGIDAMSLDVYRQDFNMEPLEYWRFADRQQADGEERRGTTEIHHINNLYRFWDTLLERYPHLLIDNCASGGRRIDAETLARSIPMWRSDYQCTWDCSPEANQVQNAAFAWWAPFSGIGYGPTLGDTYSFRSAYTNGLTIRTWEHTDADWEVGARGEPMDWARTYFREYLSIRRYFSEDYYPLVPLSAENTVWSVSQFHDPKEDSGVILAFRRSDSPVSTMTLPLKGLDLSKNYIVENRDSGEILTKSGAELSQSGPTIRMETARDSRVILYRADKES